MILGSIKIFYVCRRFTAFVTIVASVLVHRNYQMSLQDPLQVVAGLVSQYLKLLTSSVCGYHLLKQATTKIKLAVDKLPQFQCCKIGHPDAGSQHVGTIHIGSERYGVISAIIIYWFLIHELFLICSLRQLTKKMFQNC